jgi:hypothetical protein
MKVVVGYASITPYPLFSQTLFTSTYVFTRRNLAFVGSAHGVALTSRACGLWRFTYMWRQSQYANFAIFAILIVFAFPRRKRYLRKQRQ